MGTGVSKDGTIGDGIRMGAKIGSGGFSEVYSGTLKTGTPYVLWLGWWWWGWMWWWMWGWWG